MLLGTERKKLTVWVVKFPKYLGEQILASRDKLTIGKISVRRATENEPAEVQISMSEEVLSTGIPRDHLIDMKDREAGVYVVNAPLLCGREGSIEILGNVNKECLIRPVINDEYQKFRRTRNEMDSKNATATRVINYFDEARRGEKYGSLKELEFLAKKRKMQLQAKKRERLDSEDVLNMIFRAFETRELWTVKDLADFTGQPMAYIQELVSKICVLNKKDHKNSYELKPEYKNLE